MSRYCIRHKEKRCAWGHAVFYAHQLKRPFNLKIDIDQKECSSIKGNWPALGGSDLAPAMRGWRGAVPLEEAMRRRDFFKVIAGLTAAFPFAARAQQRGQVRRIGVFMPGAPD